MYLFLPNRVFQQGSGWVLLSASLFFLAQCGGDGISEVNEDEDPLYRYQWHLNDPDNDIDVNAPEAWKITEGEGIIVGVNDDGAIINHPDLEANHSSGLSYDYVNKDIDPHAPQISGASVHGTAVSGLIVGVKDNDKGIRGVAPKAKFFATNGLEAGRLLDGLTINLSNTQYAASNNSWGSVFGGTLNSISATYHEAFDNGVKNGFGGKGIVYLFSSGNDRYRRYRDPVSKKDVYYVYDNSNYSNALKHPGVFPICAVNSYGKVSFYSEPGANLLVCGPSGDGGPDRSRSKRSLTTTDRPGVDGYNRGSSSSNYKNYNYTNTFSGTSGSAPIVTGVVALIRSAGPGLTWRDVKLILASTAKKVDPGDAGWFQGAASYDGTKVGLERYAHTNAKYNHNHDFGFGLADAERAVKAAKSWKSNVGALEFTSVEVGGEGNIPAGRMNIPDNDTTGKSYKIRFYSTSIDFIEFVSVDIWIKAVGSATHSGDLRIELTSPVGKRPSILAEPHSCFLGDHPSRCEFDSRIVFSSLRHLGENPNGHWTLKVADEGEKDIHRISGWKVTVYGHRKQ